MITLDNSIPLKTDDDIVENAVENFNHSASTGRLERNSDM